ncbi:MAG: hypothetical protein ACRYFZ_20555 [Janthinobacterium lividum]
MLKNILQLLCGLLLLARTGHGQMMPPMPRYTPPVPNSNWSTMPMWQGTNPDARQGSGSYQLPDGSWHPALDLSFNGLKLVVKGEKKTLRLLAMQVNQFEIEQDTFRAVRTLPVELVNGSDFAEGLINQQGVQVWRLLGTADEYLLQLPQLPLDLLPTRKAEFKKLLLPLVSGCPALVAGITDGTFGPGDIVSIARRYLDCRAGISATGK